MSEFWKSRVTNMMFWVAVLLGLAVPILGYFGITAQDITSWVKLLEVLWQAIQNPYVVGTIAVSVYNAIVNFSTKGFKD